MARKVTGLGAYSKGRKVFRMHPANPWTVWLGLYVSEQGLTWPREYHSGPVPRVGHA